MKLKNINVIKMMALENLNYENKTSKVALELNVSLGIIISEKSDYEGLVTFDINAFDKKFSENNKPFFVNALVVGEFDTSDDNVKAHIAKSEAIVTMLPFVRTSLENIFTMLGHSYMEIPPHAFEKIVEKAKNVTPR